jgi:hypothetical protein
MNVAQQAVVIWPVLALSARMQRVLTYGEIDDFTGIPAVSQGRPLYLIHCYCKSKGYPLLNSLAVSQATGFPGDTFPDHMKEAEFLVERARVFTFGWSKNEARDFEVSQSATAGVTS